MQADRRDDGESAPVILVGDGIHHGLFYNC